VSIFEFAFDQPDLATRLQYLRSTVGLAVLVFVLSPSYGSFYREEADALARSLGKPTSWASRRHQELRGATAILAALVLLGGSHPLLLASLVVAFATLDRSVANTAPTTPNNTFHVHVFALGTLAATVAQLADAPAAASFAFTAMQVQIACVYFFAGVAKFRVGGLEWFRGRTLRAMVALRGTRLGRSAFANPRMAALASVAAVTLELSAAAAICWPAAHPWLAAALISFHVGVFATLRIPFWHLWIFFPALLVA